MSAYRPDDAPSDLRRRDLAPRTSGRGNRSAARPVVQVVGKSRAFVAAVVAAGVVLSGCASADGGEETSTTTSPAAAGEPGNPWDLPIEQRPALFDPCAEIPIEAIEEGVGKAVELSESLTRHRPGRLMGCGWINEEVHVTAASSWKSRSDYMADQSLVRVTDSRAVQDDRGLRMVESGDQTDSTCLQLFFTESGAVWIKLDIVTGLGSFRGAKFVKACDALDEAIVPIMPYIPEGDI